jgi:large subunit ribosomal protein L25
MTILKAEKREIVGKGIKRIRKQGKIPGVLYGAGEKGLLLQLSEKEFDKVFSQAGESSLIELEIEGNKKNVLIHEVALDPVGDKPLHVDFLQVRMDKPIKAKIPLSFEGESGAVKNLGGILVKVMHELEVEALPKDLPHEIKVDISGLQSLEDRVRVSDLKISKEVKVIAPKDEILVLVETPRAEEEIKAEEAAPSLESIEVVGKKKAAVAGETEAAEASTKAESKKEKAEGKKEK